MTGDVFLSVVAPFRNGAETVRAFVAALSPILTREFPHYEVLLVDDGSREEEAAAVAALLETYSGLRLLRLSRAFGLEVALLAGLEAAIGDYVALLLPETDPPELLPTLVARARQGSGVVYGVRPDRRGDSWAVRLLAPLFYRLTRRLGLQLPERATYFCVLSRQAANALVRIRDRDRYLRFLTHYLGYRAEPFPYTPRREGAPRTLGGAVRLALGVLIRYSTHPLRLVALLALAGAAGNALYAGLLAYYHLTGRVDGGAGLAPLVGAVSAALFFVILAAFSGYLRRIAVELEERPLYFVLEERQSPRLVLDPGRRDVVREE